MTQHESDSADAVWRACERCAKPVPRPVWDISLRRCKVAWLNWHAFLCDRNRTDIETGDERWSGWDQKGWKCMRNKQGDPSELDRRSWPKGPKNRPAGVRTSIVALKRGNARGAKGRREVEAQNP